MTHYFINSRVRHFTREDRDIVYFPDRSVIMQVNSAGLNLIEEMKTGGVKADKDSLQFLDTMTDLELLSTNKKAEVSSVKQTDIISDEYDFRTLTLFLTEQCNLGCIYCYADGGTGRRVMNYETAETALKFMADHCAETKRDFHIAYHGSGEPTCAGGMLGQTVKLSEELAEQKGLDLQFSIGTNGVMDDRYRNLLIEKDFDISLSLDGFENTHNALRPMPDGNSFREAMKTAYACTGRDHPFSVRTTVTDRNMGELDEFASFLFKNTSCEVIQLEPVYTAGRAASGAVRHPGIDEFTEMYFKCLETAESLDRNVCYSGISYPARRDFFCQACGMSLCVRPDGIYFFFLFLFFQTLFKFS